MNRSKLNFLLDATAAALMIGLVVTGLITRYVLPPGSGQWRLLWGLNRHEWGDIHFWVAVATVVVILVHVALHWNWVGCMLRVFKCAPEEGAAGKPAPWNRTGALILFFIVLAVTVFIVVAKNSIVTVERQRSRALESTRGAYP